MFPQNGHRLSECPVKDAELTGKGKGKFGKGNNKGKGQVKGSDFKGSDKIGSSRTTDTCGTVGTRARAVKMQARAGVRTEFGKKMCGKTVLAHKQCSCLA